MEVSPSESKKLVNLIQYFKEVGPHFPQKNIMSRIIEKEWTTKEGLDARVVFIKNSHRCGYVSVKKDHWLYGVGYNDLYILNVHGGLTFGSEIKDSEDWWIGFDCAHSGDKTMFNQSGEERTTKFCIDECEDLARQITKLNGTSFAYCCIAKISKTRLKEDLHNEMIALSLKDDIYAKEYFEMLKNSFQEDPN